MNSKLWIIDDEESIRTICKSALEDDFDIILFPNASEALLALNSSIPDLIITDIKMPGMSGIDFLKKISTKHPNIPTIVITAHTDIENALSAFQEGAFEYLTKPFNVDEIRKIALKALKTSSINKTDNKSDLSPDDQIQKIVGRAHSLQKVFRAIGKISVSDLSVLIRGESGTGKELIAEAIHINSSRKDKPFVAINVAAIPHELLESELFGHEKGAFTGAQSQRIGRFEQASGGTLFLDEIGDMHPELQTRLLRVLSSQEFYRVGGHNPIKSNVRIVAATNQSIEKLIENSKFREDLFHRLNVFKLQLPPLRDRKEDIEVLTKHFLSLSSKELNVSEKTLDKKVLSFFENYEWPGNIRQLENVCRYLTVMCSSSIITTDDLPDDITDSNSKTANTSTNGENSWESLLESEIRDRVVNEKDVLIKINEKLQKLLINESLRASNGVKQDAAKLLGWGRNTLARKAKDLN